MGSLDHMRDLIEEIRKQKIHYVLITHQKYKTHNNSQIFESFDAPETHQEIVDEMKKYIADFDKSKKKRKKKDGE